MAHNGDVRSSPVFRVSSGGAALLLGLLTFILYGHTLHVPWYMDDAAMIVENPLIRDLPTALCDFWKPRGIVALTFALNYHFSGLDPASYHLVNIFIHFVAGHLVFLLLRRIFTGDRLLALCGALLFIAHPLQTQAITYTTQRATSLAGLFFLLAIYLFVRSREVLLTGVAFRSAAHLLWYGGALLAGALAMLCKENAAVLPFALLLFESFFVSPLPGWKIRLCSIAPFAFLPLAVGFSMLASAESLGQASNYANLASLQGNSPVHYLVTEFSVLWIYLRLFLFPIGQALDHDYPIVREIISLQNGLALLGLLLLAWFAWRKKEEWPALSFGISWFFLTLAIESSVVPLDPLFEHRLYLPLFGLVVVSMDGLRRISWPKATIAVGCSLLIPLAILTWQRNQLWNDPIAFYEDNLRRAPKSERASNGLGLSYYAGGRLPEAEAAFLHTLAINPKYFYNYGNLPALYQQQGRVDEAIALLEQGINYFPEHAVLYNNLGCIYDNLAASAHSSYQNAQAVRHFEQAIKLDPKFAPAFGNLGRHYKRLGALREAEPLLRQAVALNPQDVQFRADLADILQRTGRFAEAAAVRK